MLSDKVEATVEQILESLSKGKSVSLRVESGSYEFFPNGSLDKTLKPVWTCRGLAYHHGYADALDQPLEAKLVVHDPETAQARISLEIMP